MRNLHYRFLLLCFIATPIMPIFGQPGPTTGTVSISQFNGFGWVNTQIPAVPGDALGFDSGGTITTITAGGGVTPISLGGTGQTTANAALNALLPTQTGLTDYVFQTDGTNTFWGPNGGTVPIGANPTASLGLTAINGSSANFMRADSAPALSQAIAPTWTGVHTYLHTAIGANSAIDATVNSNTTAANSSTVQYSPAIHFKGSSWATGGTPAAVSVDAKEQLQTNSSASGGGELTWLFFNSGTGTYLNAGMLDNTGHMTLGNSSSLSGSLTLGGSTNGGLYISDNFGDVQVGQIPPAAGGTGEANSGGLVFSSFITFNGANNATFNISTPSTNVTVPGSGTLLSDATAVTIAQGGTGQTTAANAINALLPPQTGQSGNFLTTNGTVSSWAAGGSGSVANPTATIGLTAVNGTATSAIRSDGAPALSQTITPTWTGEHQYSFPALGITTIPAIVMENLTNGASGAPQYSPALYLVGSGYNTVGATTVSNMARLYDSPLSAASVNGTGSAKFDLSVNGGTTWTNIITFNLNSSCVFSTGLTASSFSANNGVSVGTALTTPHIIGSGSAPTVAAGAGAGSSPTVTVSNAHDCAFTLSVTTGLTPSASAVVATVTFATAYTNAPHFSVDPTNASAGLLSGVSNVYGTSTTTTFVLNVETTALLPSTTYTWEVLVVQ